MLQRTVTMSWNGSWRLPAQIGEPNGRITTLTYDTSSGNLLTRSVSAPGTPSPRTTTYTYTASSQVQSIKDALNNTTSFGYTTAGDLLYMKNALLQTTTFAYNTAGRVTGMTDPNLFVTSASYDSRNRLTKLIRGTATTTYAYGANGLVQQVTQPDGTYLTFTYDAAHRLTAVTNRNSEHIDYALDDAGNRTRTAIYATAGTSSPVYVETATYDYMNRLIGRSASGDPARTTLYGYDPNGNVTSVTDPLGRTATSGYDNLNRLAWTTDALAETATYAYDANGNLTSVTDPRGLVTGYGYNGFGDQLTENSPDSGTRSRSYNAVGNVASVTDTLANTATYAYDALNRTTAVKVLTMPWTELRYDDATAGSFGIGRLSSMTDATGTTGFTYDGVGHVTGKSHAMNSGGPTLSAAWAYSATSLQLRTETYPSGTVQTYVYDANTGRPSITYTGVMVIRGIAWQPFGPLAGYKEVTTGTSTDAEFTRTFGGDGYITQTGITAASGSLPGVETQSLTRDAAGQVTALTEGGTSSATGLFLNRTATYDLLGRVATLAVTSPASYQNFTYDANGNITAQNTTGGASTAYAMAPGTNRLTGLSGLVTQSASYDANGNLTKIIYNGTSTATFTSNVQRQLSSAQPAGLANTATYVTNGFGQRTKKAYPPLATGANLYFYDTDGNLMGVYDRTGARLQETVWLDNLPWGVMYPSAHYFATTDYLGAMRSLTFNNGNAVWAWDHDAYGTTQPNQNPNGYGTVAYDLRMPGQYYDAETGLTYNMARYVNSQWGRFVQADPIGMAGAGIGAVNLYSYADGNPLMWIDPSELVACTCQSSEFGGTRKDSGEKICTYFCTCDGCPTKISVPYSAGSSDNARCIGQIDPEWTQPGSILHFNKFNFDTESFFDKYINSFVPNGFMDRIKEKLPIDPQVKLKSPQ